LSTVISLTKIFSALVRDAVLSPASSKASRSRRAFSDAVSIRMSKSNVALGTPCRTAAMPPIKTYLT